MTPMEKRSRLMKWASEKISVSGQAILVWVSKIQYHSMQFKCFWDSGLEKYKYTLQQKNMYDTQCPFILRKM